ncbi:MAG TPA: tape measure protein [Ruminiclostridium sp.]|nr:tape measure protein [Ruminiclostridium sp.]
MATVSNALQLTGTKALSTVARPMTDIVARTEAVRNAFKKPLKMDGFKSSSKDVTELSKALLAIQNDVTASASKFNKSAETVAKSMDQIKEKSRKATDTSGKKSEAEKRSEKEKRSGITEPFLKPISPEVSIMGKKLDVLSAAKTGMAMVDKYSTQNSRLSAMTDGTQQSTGKLQQKVYSAAQSSRSGYDSTVSTVTKLGFSAKDKFNGSNDEIIAFTELLNKSFAGADPGAATKGIDKITDAMASGKLKKEDMVSVFQNAPALGQAVSKYTGQSQEKLLAGDGISADVLKNSMFSGANEINAQFMALPVTFQQIGTSLQNTLLQAFGPVMAAIAEGAKWVYDNWSTIGPIFWGIAAAVGAFAIGLGIATIAENILNLALLASPLFWIALLIGVVIGVIALWIQSVGGIHVAWLIVVNAILTIWDILKIAFFMGVYAVIDLWNQMMLGMKTAGVAIQNLMGDMKVGVLMILQNMVNGAIDIINKFIGLLNKLPGVQIDAIGKVTFGTEAKAQNDAEKKAREADLEQYKNKIAAIKQQHDMNIIDRTVQAGVDEQKREDAIKVAQATTKKKQSNKTNFNVPLYTADNGGAKGKSNITTLQNPAAAGIPGIPSGLGDTDTKNNIANTAANTSAMKDTMDVSEEDMKYMRDIAEQEVINRFTTSEIKVDMTNHNNINSKLDLDGVVSYMEQKVYETLSVAAEGVYS